MKRFHVHLHVDDLNRSIGFYSQLFAAQPARAEGEYAKWMLEDPPVNFVRRSPAPSAKGQEVRGDGHRTHGPHLAVA